MDTSAALRRVSTVARVVDLSRPSNRFAVLAAGVAGVVTLVVALVAGDGGLGGALGEGLRAGVGVFLAWALGRELDPDRARTARYATFAAAALLLVGPPGLAALLAVLVAVRVVARPTGLPPTVADLVAALVITGLAASRPTGFVPALGLSFALVWDTRLPVRAPRTSGAVGAAALAVAVVAAILSGALDVDWTAPGPVEIVVFLAALAASARLGSPAPRSRTDATGEPLHPMRLLRARVLVGAVLAGSLVWVGGAAVTALAGAWTAIAATGAVRWWETRRRPTGDERPVERSSPRTR